MESGYKLPSEILEHISGLREPRFVWYLGSALLDHIGILVGPVAVVAAIYEGSFPTYFAAILFAAWQVTFGVRSMRGLECLLHEASHSNWTRSQQLNDFAAWALVATPVLISLNRYRETHNDHHRYLGTSRDVDWVRWDNLDLDAVDWSSRIALLRLVTGQYFRYQTGWLSAVSNGARTVAAAAVWHLSVCGLLFLAGGRNGLIVWILAWPVTYFLLLPFVRCAGELEEHNYGREQTIVRVTNTNLGLVQRFLLHPHGDSYHTIHHLSPLIQPYRLRRLHRWLLENDEAYSMLVPVRSRYTEPPIVKEAV